MELINSTRMPAAFTVFTEPSGREVVVVVVKGTFRIPNETGSPLRLHQEQMPLVTSDEFFGEPGVSAPKYEVDFAPRKQRCDLLLNASAWAPDGRPAVSVPVGVGIGAWSKAFQVVGDRYWEVGVTGVGAGPPAPFTTMPITYDLAFGGTDNKSEKPADHVAFMANPSGRGFHKHLKREWVTGSPLPNTEESRNQVTRPDGPYRPMSFGPVGRQWEPRSRYAGTYDQQWQDDVFPFLPGDFDEQYFQVAPQDQQLPMPLSGQVVTLINLTPGSRSQFALPHAAASITMFPRKGGREDHSSEFDTVVIEPDLARVMITWRVARPLEHNIFEIAQILVGRQNRDSRPERDAASGFSEP